MIQRTVFYVSDQTAITVQALGQSVLLQFPGLTAEFVRRAFVDTREKAERVREEIDAAAQRTGMRPIVFSSLSNDELLTVVKRADALCLDFLESYLAPLEAELGVESAHSMGHPHGAPDTAAYDQRIAAINFTLSHDDGATTAQLDLADVILVGVSRSGKTPTCLYLSLRFGIHAANFPLTEEDLERPQLPHSLRPYRDKLYALSVDPVRVHHIRQARRPGSRYASLAQCQFEVLQTQKLCRLQKIPVLDSTNKSIEEIATNIMQDRGLTPTLY